MMLQNIGIILYAIGRIKLPAADVSAHYLIGYKSRIIDATVLRCMTNTNSNTSITIIPAYSGHHWLLARVDDNNNLIGILHLPVLAWSISNDTCIDCDTEEMHVTPITYRGQEESEYGALQLPDGGIYAPYDDITFSSEAHLLAWWEELRAEEADACNAPNATMVN